MLTQRPEGRVCFSTHWRYSRACFAPNGLIPSSALADQNSIPLNPALWHSVRVAATPRDASISLISVLLHHTFFGAYALGYAVLSILAN